MFEHGVPPDLRYCEHPAVHVPAHAEHVYVDMRFLNEGRRGIGSRIGGLPVGYTVEGLLLSKVMTDWGHWLGDVLIEWPEGGRIVAVTRLLAPQWAIKPASLKAKRELGGKTSNRPVMGRPRAPGRS